MRLSYILFSLLLSSLPATAATVSLVAGAVLDFDVSLEKSTNDQPADLRPLKVERFGQTLCPDVQLTTPGRVTASCSGGAIITNHSENTLWRVSYSRPYYAVIRASLAPDEADFLIDASVQINYTAGPLNRPDLPLLTTDVGTRLALDELDVVDGFGQDFTLFNPIEGPEKAVLGPTSSPLLLAYSISFSAELKSPAVTDGVHPAPVPLPGSVFGLITALALVPLARYRRSPRKGATR